MVLESVSFARVKTYLVKCLFSLRLDMLQLNPGIMWSDFSFRSIQSSFITELALFQFTYSLIK